MLDQSRVHQAPTRSVDVIVSTVELHDAPVPHIVVNPLLPTEDERRLQRWVTEVTGGRRVSAGRPQRWQNRCFN
ncbi:hypothetical protein GCM10025857_21870 [Alicyclobacillus contaminans]|nr:hypothetical protein GCM10025857_21870 [Alicyclobacillus contaminans]